MLFLCMHNAAAHAKTQQTRAHPRGPRCSQSRAASARTGSCFVCVVCWCCVGFGVRCARKRLVPVLFKRARASCFLVHAARVSTHAARAPTHAKTNNAHQNMSGASCLCCWVAAAASGLDTRGTTTRCAVPLCRCAAAAKRSAGAAMGVLMARPLGRCTEDAVLNAVDLNTRARMFVLRGAGVLGVCMEKFLGSAKKEIAVWTSNLNVYKTLCLIDRRT